MSNVISLTDKQIDAEVEAEIEAEGDKFDRLYIRYLRAKARRLDAQSNEAGTKADDAFDDLIWKIIGATASMPHHLQRKFDVLDDLIDSRTDKRFGALIASIRSDVE